jgi:hypothetical protein
MLYLSRSRPARGLRQIFPKSYAEAGETSPLRELETSFLQLCKEDVFRHELITMSRSLVVNSALMTDGFSKHGSRPTIGWESRLGRALRFETD